LKHRNLSITWKIFLYLLAFVVIVVAAITFVQTYALERSYERDRINSVRQIANIVLAQSDITDFENILDNAAMHEDCCVHIYDQNGEVIWCSQRLRSCAIHRMTQPQVEELMAEAAASRDGSALQKEELDLTVFGEPPRGKEDIPRPKELDAAPKPGMISSIKLKSLAYALYAQDSLGNQRYVLISTTLTPLNSTVQVLGQSMFLVVAFLVLAAALLAWLMSKGIAKPIISINNSAKELSKHHYNVVFETNGYREITELRDTLNEAAVELNKTEELRRDLMANISHDLRTPLTMIVGYGEVMRDIPGENTPENLQVIIDEANRLGHLVEDVLDLSRMEANADEMQMEPLDLTRAVKDMVNRCARMVAKDGFTIHFGAGEAAWVQGDELRLSQVVYNLIGNALTHTGSSREVWVEQQVEDGWVRISVRDCGEGIPAEKLKDIWQRYYKVDKVHKRSRVGSGLGLSIVKGIVESHGGRCGVESEFGKGSTFWFSLPMV